jgi:hypothetical protein
LSAGDSNLYRYVSNSPPLFSDPSGTGKIANDGVPTVVPDDVATVRRVAFGDTAGNNARTAVGKTNNFVSLDILFHMTSNLDLEFEVTNTKGIAAFWFEFHIINLTDDTWDAFSAILGTGTAKKFLPLDVEVLSPLSQYFMKSSDFPLRFNQREGNFLYFPQGEKVKPFTTIIKGPYRDVLWNGSVPPGASNGLNLFQAINIPDSDTPGMPLSVQKSKGGYKFTVSLSPVAPKKKNG